MFKTLTPGRPLPRPSNPRRKAGAVQLRSRATPNSSTFSRSRIDPSPWRSAEVVQRHWRGVLSTRRQASCFIKSDSQDPYQGHISSSNNNPGSRDARDLPMSKVCAGGILRAGDREVKRGPSRQPQRARKQPLHGVGNKVPFMIRDRHSRWVCVSGHIRVTYGAR